MIEDNTKTLNNRWYDIIQYNNKKVYYIYNLYYYITFNIRIKYYLIAYQNEDQDIIDQLGIEDFDFSISIHYIYNIEAIERNSNLNIKESWLLEYISNVYIIKILNPNINLIELEDYNSDLILNISRRKRIRLE